MIYKAKPKVDGEANQDSLAKPIEQAQPTAESTLPTEQAPTTEKPKKDKPKRERKPKAAAQPGATEEKKEEASSAPVSEKKQDSEQPSQQSAKAEKPKKERAPKDRAHSAQGPAAAASSSELQQLQQLLIQKEKEIGNLHISFDKQEAKVAAQAKESEQLKEQLKLNSDGNTLKQAIQALNEQLTKQQNLNRL